MNENSNKKNKSTLLFLLKANKQNKVPFFFWFDHILEAGGIFLFVWGRMEDSTIPFEICGPLVFSERKVMPKSF